MIRSNPTSQNDSPNFKLNPITMGIINSMNADQAASIIQKMESLPSDIFSIAEDTLRGYQGAMNINKDQFNIEGKQKMEKIVVNMVADNKEIYSQAAA